MKDYKLEIINKGKETLEKFLLLLKEDFILSKNRKDEMNIISKNHFNFTAKTIEKLKPNEGLEGKEVLVNREEFLEMREKIDVFDKLSESQYLASNAYFIYLFALFDQFILEVGKLSLNNDTEIMKRYKNYCLNNFKSHKDQNLYEILPFEDKLIDYFPNLASPLSVIMKLLEINFKEEKYIDHYFNFIEMKERRNLLVHRSSIADKLYFKTIKKYLSKYPQDKVNDFVNKLKNSNHKELKIDQEYFSETISTLYFLVCIIVNKIISKNNLAKKTIIFTDGFNDFLDFTLENEEVSNLVTTPLELFQIYKSEYLENDLSRMNDVDKVNWILFNELGKERSNKSVEEAKKSKNFDSSVMEERLPIIIERFNFTNDTLLNFIEDNLIKDIITSYLEKNHQSYIKNIFDFAKRESIYLKFIESKWYMHKKLLKDNKFRQKYFTYKEKNNFEPEEIKVKLPENTNRKK
tara:strand:+ start:294 stop:1685 length:1392 start_codon:yes stop_codon:yes gene_type:complete